MFPFQDSELYRAALDLNVIVEDVGNNDGERTPEAALGRLSQTANSLMLSVAHASQCDPGERHLYREDIRDSALVCAAMIDVCQGAGFLEAGQKERVVAAVERIVELTKDATSRRTRR